MKRVTEAWLHKAGEDLEAVRALRLRPHLTPLIAFHAQQCVEKCLKAVAEERLGKSPRIHDLRRLWEIVADQFSEALDIDMLRELTDLYTESRYPGEFGLIATGRPTEKDASRFECFAEQVHAAALAILS